MDIHTIRMELRTKSIYDLPLRVTYYARVSSESDVQLNSLGNQVSYYEDLIRRNLPWTFVPGLAGLRMMTLFDASCCQLRPRSCAKRTQ